MRDGVWPGRIAIIGCGLIGTSLALAIRPASERSTLIGIEANGSYRDTVRQMNVFDTVLGEDAAVPEVDLAILALPVSACVDWLRMHGGNVPLILDVCSVKGEICSAVEALGLQQRFIPTHPMAGKSVGGPHNATADLFTGRSWILLENYPDYARAIPWIRSLGAEEVILPSAEKHDEMLAVVSHGIHVTSVTSMLAAGRLGTPEWFRTAGPAFRDITRLAGSPDSFWTETLLANRAQTLSYLTALSEAVREFQEALQQGDTTSIQKLLVESKVYFDTWREEDLT